MSFEALKTQNSPLEKAFEKASKTFSLPSVLPHEVGALQTLLVTQQNAHLAVVQGLHQVVQAAHQEAQEQVQAAHQEALAMRAEAQTIRDEAHAYVIRMLEQATLARQRMFGASSEQMSAQSRFTGTPRLVKHFMCLLFLDYGIPDDVRVETTKKREQTAHLQTALLHLLCGPRYEPLGGAPFV